MTLTILPFAEEHLDAAAALFAARHRAGHAHEPDFPERLAQPAHAREFLQQAWSLPMTEGVVAMRDGQVAGYLFGSIVLPEPTSVMSLFVAPRAAQIGDPGYAAEPDDADHIYRVLYAAAAPSWLRAGCFAHSVIVRTCDPVAADAWLSLGFGREMVSGVHDLAPSEQQWSSPGGFEITRAGSEDVDAVFQMFRDNLRYHTRSPIFDGYFNEIEPSLHADVERLLTDSETSPVWVAYRGVLPIGVINLVPPRLRATTPDQTVHLQQGYTEPAARGSGVATALLAEAFAWARDAGYGRCTINWHTANLLGARFWQRSGFRPITWSLVRRIDERIAWARPAVDAAPPSAR
jgi:GNAT superfamily N-acetyltransferase